MAHFSSRLKLLSSNDGLSFGVDSRDQLRQSLYMAGGGTPLVPIRRSRLKFCARIFSSYSFPYKRKIIRDFDNTEKNLGIDEDNDEWDFDGDDDGLETDDLSCFRGLVLDISYRPVNVVCWKRAICLEYMDKADVLEYYDQTVSSPTGSFYIPAVLRVHRAYYRQRKKIEVNAKSTKASQVAADVDRG